MGYRNRLQQTWSILLIMLATLGAAAQDKPDFSGRWVLYTPQQSDGEIPLVLSVHQSLVTTTVRGGNALVFDSGSYTGQRPETGTWTERREVWSLDDDGRLRLAITTRSSGDGSRDITLVYRRP